MNIEDTIAFDCEQCGARLSARRPAPRGKKLAVRCPRCAHINKDWASRQTTRDAPPKARPRRQRVATGGPDHDAGAYSLSFVPQLRSDGDSGDDPELAVSFEFDFDSHYDVLGVGFNATAQDAKDASMALNRILRGQAMKGDKKAEERLKQVTRAQEVLSKAEKRAEYDRQAETKFLSIQDPALSEDIGLSEGLEIIRELSIGVDDRDPVREAAWALKGASPIEPQPCTLLDRILSEGKGRRR